MDTHHGLCSTPNNTWGIDLHARTMHLCLLDHAGQIVFDRNLACRPETLRRAIEPFRDGLVFGASSLVTAHRSWAVGVVPV
jgi:hypothetical protein